MASLPSWSDLDGLLGWTDMSEGIEPRQCATRQAYVRPCVPSPVLQRKLKSRCDGACMQSQYSEG